MEENYELVAQVASEAEQLLLKNTIFRRSLEHDDAWKRELLIFVKQVQKQAAEKQFTAEIGAKADALLMLKNNMPPETREPAFRCVASHKTCMAEANTISEKLLCGLALVICLAKEVIPLA